MDGSTTPYRTISTTGTATGVCQVPASYGLGGNIAVSDSHGIDFFDKESGAYKGRTELPTTTIKGITYDWTRNRLIISDDNGPQAVVGSTLQSLNGLANAGLCAVSMKNGFDDIIFDGSTASYLNDICLAA